MNYLSERQPALLNSFLTNDAIWHHETFSFMMSILAMSFGWDKEEEVGEFNRKHGQSFLSVWHKWTSHLNLQGLHFNHSSPFFRLPFPEGLN